MGVVLSHCPATQQSALPEEEREAAYRARNHEALCKSTLKRLRDTHLPHELVSRACMHARTTPLRRRRALGLPHSGLLRLLATPALLRSAQSTLGTLYY